MDGTPQYVNPMDMNLNYSEDDSPLALKSDFILSLCELVIGGKEGLQPVDKTVIDRAVRNVYRDYLADPDPEKMPILGDLYDELLKQPEPEAARIAAALKLYVSGSLNVFKMCIRDSVYTGAIASQKKDYRFKIGTIGEKKPEDWIVVEGQMCIRDSRQPDFPEIRKDKCKRISC